MDVLIVDDQISVVNGIEHGIQWESMGVLKVWKAYNAIEAKSIIQNENVDILLCDIEMPGEDGLSLCRWIRQNNYEIECVLLTAHADFEFAREAVCLGVFDYILQPARYEEIRDVLLKVKKRINEKREMKKFSDMGRLFNLKKQVILDDIMKGGILEKVIDKKIFDELKALGYSVEEENGVYCSLIEILQWKDENKKLDNTLFSFVTGNIIQELLSKCPVSVICTCLDRDIMCCLIIGDKETIPQIQDIKRQLSKYLGIIFQLYSCKTACFLDNIVGFKDVAKSINDLDKIRVKIEKREVKIYFNVNGERDKNVGMFLDEQDYVEEAVRYIRCNIEEPLSRTEIARYVNLNEDYLSRLFRRKKGISLKEFIINEKMAVAKKLLQSTALPVGVIAAKVGYDNFSHFSSTYRKIVGKSPMEERG